MDLQQRIKLLSGLGDYIKNDGLAWQEAKQQAYYENGWFTTEFSQHAASQIAHQFLNEKALTEWAQHYNIRAQDTTKNIGIVMAGNIPLVGFHDFLCAFICGHQQTIKPSAKDAVLLKHLVQWMYSQNIETQNYVGFAPMLKGCDAYIATGSNNAGRYFEQYFSNYPNIIRKNRTSVAVLTGDETADELLLLADDIHMYFGLGCRNVTKIYVPEHYNFEPLLKSFDRYLFFADHHKYKNNYDYQLSIMLLNNQYYMTNGATLLAENGNFFSPISQLYYQFYADAGVPEQSLKQNDSIQCIIGKQFLAFGEAQQPGLFNYADGVDTMDFLTGLL